MAKQRRHINPFYLLLALVGALFCVTASAYALVTFQALKSVPASLPGAREHALRLLFSQHGNTIVGAELALLVMLSVGAIATDEYWRRRTQNGDRSHPGSRPGI